MIKLMELVDADTGISWWDRNRERLNETITLFNDWQTKHRFATWEKEILKANINLCRAFGEAKKFSDWHFEILNDMETFIKEHEIRTEGNHHE